MGRVIRGEAEGADLGEDGRPPRRPLSDVRVFLLRPAGRTAGLSRSLELLGADVVSRPAIEVSPSHGPELVAAARALAARAYDWAIFTSVAGVEATWDCAPADLAAAMEWVNAAAVGPATARALRQRGVSRIVVATPHTSAALARLLTGTYGPAHALMPVSALATDAAAGTLRAAGWQVHRVDAYRVRACGGSLKELPGVHTSEGRRDVVVFTSPSQVRAAATETAVMDCRVVTIGPVTSSACRERGLRVDAEAAVADLPGIVDGIVAATKHGRVPTPHPPTVLSGAIK